MIVRIGKPLLNHLFKCAFSEEIWTMKIRFGDFYLVPRKEMRSGEFITTFKEVTMCCKSILLSDLAYNSGANHPNSTILHIISQ